MSARIDSWIKRITTHSEQGKVLDLSEAEDPDGTPARERAFPASRRIPAEALVASVLAAGQASFRHGVRIRGARIQGQIDLRSVRLPFGIELVNCALDEGLDLDDAEIGHLRLIQTRSAELSARRTRMLGDLQLSGSHFEGLVKTQPVISLERVSIGGGLFMNGGFTATGEIRAISAMIDGSLLMDGASLQNSGGVSIGLDSARVDGNATFDGGFRSTGELRAVGAWIKGQLSFSGAVTENPEGDSLCLDRVHVGSGLFLDDGFRAIGQVRALGASVAGQLHIRAAKLEGSNGMALALDGAQISGDVMVVDGLEADGEVRAPGAEIGGQLVISQATVTNPTGAALTFDGITVKEDVYLRDGLKAFGEVRFGGAKIQGQLGMPGARLSNPGKTALNVDQARIGGSLLLSEGFSADGHVQIRAATISSQTVIIGAEIANLEGTALSFDSSRLDGGTIISAAIMGRISMVHATIGMTLFWRVSSGNEKLAVDATGANIQVFDQRLQGTATQCFDLSRATLDRWTTDVAGSIQLTGAAGWTLGTVQGALLSNHNEAIRILDDAQGDSKRAFVAQPWRELAGAVERAGEPSRARRIRWMAARRTTTASWWLPRWTIRRLYSYTVGYGYYPLLTLIWLAGLWVLVAGISIAFSGQFVPTDWRLLEEINNAPKSSASLLASYPTFNPWLFALDTSLPVSSMGQAASWRLDNQPLLSALFAAAKAASWALTALLLAGITGVLRKD